MPEPVDGLRSEGTAVAGPLAGRAAVARSPGAPPLRPGAANSCTGVCTGLAPRCTMEPGAVGADAGVGPVVVVGLVVLLVAPLLLPVKTPGTKALACTRHVAWGK